MNLNLNGLMVAGPAGALRITEICQGPCSDFPDCRGTCIFKKLFPSPLIVLAPFIMPYLFYWRVHNLISCTNYITKLKITLKFESSHMLLQIWGRLVCPLSQPEKNEPSLVIQVTLFSWQLAAGSSCWVLVKRTYAWFFEGHESLCNWIFDQ